MRGFLLLRALAVVVCVLGAAQAASAQGFGVYEQSPCQLGRGGAGVASPCPDASSVYFNPAGLSFEATQIGLGGTVIGPRGDFTDDTTGKVSSLNKKWYPLPNVYASTPIGDRFAVGIGIFAPYGLTTDWPEESQGRFLGYKSVVQGVYIQPTASYKVNDRLSVGAGIDLVRLHVQLRQRLDLSAQALPAVPGLPPGATFGTLGVRAGTDFADINLEGDAWSVGAHFGVLYKASEKVSLGARFMTGQSVEIEEGTIETRQIPTPFVLPVAIPGVAPRGTKLDLLLASRFQPGQLLGPQGAQSEIPLPAQLVAGIAYQATPALKLLADYQFVNWSAFDELPVNGDFLQSSVPENYNDTHGVRAGAEYALSEATTLRAGVDFHTAAAPDETVTPNLPEGVRREFSVGIGQRLSDNLRVDAFYLYLSQPERAGRTNPTTNNGVYSFKANLFGVSFAFGF
ncbi:MAG TPA: outer membrane protein transport protein [Vicinamibacterales bacterium]|nr:outer membrane protein transport protein [Vicinamibacterales bacterium]